MSTLELEVGDLKPRAVEFTASELVVTLMDGRKVATPLEWYPRLHKASAAQRADYEIMPLGIHWPALDEDLWPAPGLVDTRLSESGLHFELHGT